MKRVAIFVSACALVVGPAFPAQAADDASGLVGTWRGTTSGFQDGQYFQLETRMIVTKSRGTAFLGSKSWRLPGEKWSAPDRTTGVLLPNGDVRWVDGDGIFLGSLPTPDTLRGTYMEPGTDDQAVFDHVLRKVK